jgi:hypothetical protein
MKPSRLEEHLTKIHPDRKDTNLSYFQMLKEQHSRCPTLAGMFSVASKLKLKLKNGYQEIWLQRQIPVLYPALWAASKKFFIAFPSSYLAKRGFSIVSNLLTKKRNRLSIVERGDLRLLMTNMAPNIEKLVLLH